MVHIELSSRGRDTIALEMPDISYFSTNRSGGLEENCWEAENKLLTYRISCLLYTSPSPRDTR